MDVVPTGKVNSRTINLTIAYILYSAAQPDDVRSSVGPAQWRVSWPRTPEQIAQDRIGYA